MNLVRVGEGTRLHAVDNKEGGVRTLCGLKLTGQREVQLPLFLEDAELVMCAWCRAATEVLEMERVRA